MAADIDSLFDQDAFSDLEPERLELFRSFAYQIEGKSGPEIISLFMRFHKELSKGRPLDPYEKQAIIEAIGDFLPDSEQAKFRTVVRMLDKFV
ncbi:MAG: hypothetical protein LBU32_04960 [Clostridiales bacterium]|jgi:hypothetical protein|nr:hypothetical protein [Clostridiales bacterium]